MAVRPARTDDALAIARIYNQGIEERIATFEVEPRTADDIVQALMDRGDRYPTVVAEREGKVVAVAWVSQYRPRTCYDGIGEFSVYTDRASRGSGAGREVMEGLIAECERRGFWKLVARIFPENSASRNLCLRLGFREVGIYERHGKLDGQWRDCVIVELLIDESRYRNVVREASRRGISTGAVIRQAIDDLPDDSEDRRAAIQAILAAEPAAVPENPAELRAELDRAHDPFSQ